MANEFYTLIVVPHAKARFRKIQVPVKLTKWALGVSGTAAPLRQRPHGPLHPGGRRGLPAPGPEPGPEHQEPRVPAERRPPPDQDQRSPERGHQARGHGRAGAGPPRPQGRRRGRRAEPGDRRARRRALGPAEHGRQRLEAGRAVPEARGVLPGPARPPVLDALRLAGPRLPLGRLRQPDRPVHRPAGLPPRHRHLHAASGPRSRRRPTASSSPAATRAATATPSSSTTSTAS